MGLGSLWDSFWLCHSLISWFYWPVCRSWQFLPEPGKWYGNWAHGVWQETRSFLQRGCDDGQDGFRRNSVSECFWITSSPSEGNDEEERNSAVTVHMETDPELISKEPPRESCAQRVSSVPLEGCLCVPNRLWLALLYCLSWKALWWNWVVMTL